MDNLIINRIDILEEKKTEQVVGYHRFMLKFPKNKDKPFCIVEGEDEKYYSIRVKLICDNIEPIFISCNGKQGVLDTFSLIEMKVEYKEGKVFYFVDKDFDSLQLNSKIYVTPCYSVENFYTTPDAVAGIARNIFGFDIDEPDYNSFFSIFFARQSEFHFATRLFNAWIACQSNEIRIGRNSRLNLNSVKIREMITITLDQVYQEYDLDRIESLFPNASKISQEQIDQRILMFEDINPQQTFRGKYELQFLCKMIELFQEDIGKREPCYFKNRKKVSLLFYDVLSQFSAFATTPDSLVSYVNAYWRGTSASIT